MLVYCVDASVGVSLVALLSPFVVAFLPLDY